MKASEVFILGTVAGAVAVWFWRRELDHYLGDTTRRVRAQATAGIEAIEEKAGKMLEHVSGVLKAGQDAIRPAP